MTDAQADRLFLEISANVALAKARAKHGFTED